MVSGRCWISFSAVEFLTLEYLSMVSATLGELSCTQSLTTHSKRFETAVWPHETWNVKALNNESNYKNHEKVCLLLQHHGVCHLADLSRWCDPRVGALRRTRVLQLLTSSRITFCKASTRQSTGFADVNPWLSAKGDMDIVLSTSCMGFTNDPVL